MQLPTRVVIVGGAGGMGRFFATKVFLPAGAVLPRSPAPPEMWRALDAGRRHVCDLARGAVTPNIVCLDVGVLYLHPDRLMAEMSWSRVAETRQKVFDLLASMAEGSIALAVMMSVGRPACAGMGWSRCAAPRVTWR